MDRRWPETASAGQVVLHSSSATERQPVPHLPSPPRSISEIGSVVGAQDQLEGTGIQLLPSRSNASSSSPQPKSLELPRKDVLSLLYINPNQETTKPEMVFKKVREVLNDSQKHQELLALQGDYAQAVLDLLKKVSVERSCHPRAGTTQVLDHQEVPDDLKNPVLITIKQLCQKIGLHPRIPTFQGARVEDEPITAGTFGDTWKASYRAYPECVSETLTFGHFEHPNIIPFYGIFHMEDSVGRIGMVTPWMSNGTVDKYLDLNPEAPRLPLVYDMLEGLGHLHAQSVIHGNLRSANVLMTPTGTACIADYGLCSVIALANMSEIQDSNLRWKAPELMEELQDGFFPSPTPSSDVYSAASVMYEILVGRMPFFEFKHDSTVVSRVTRGIRPMKPSTQQHLELSDEIWAIMMQSWRGNPDERPIVQQVLESLQQIPPLPLTMTRLWKVMQKQRTDFRSPLAASAFRAAVLGDAQIFEHSLIRL
ncbi:hypothetical protein D9756_009413 [Leucocoprinus leucothites]|uniref:Protein kinase domain-containing protein n=1 Tax=Leucocoprinus leucothites TaxID=201217 RepID=A0A8H5FU55_9AGAR|nr:hypothetical protein D9756_009413 [Leucoagaricus leucothites]